MTLELTTTDAIVDPAAFVVMSVDVMTTVVCSTMGVEVVIKVGVVVVVGATVVCWVVGVGVVVGAVVGVMGVVVGFVVGGGTTLGVVDGAEGGLEAADAAELGLVASWRRNIMSFSSTTGQRGVEETVVKMAIRATRKDILNNSILAIVVVSGSRMWVVRRRVQVWAGARWQVPSRTAGCIKQARSAVEVGSDGCEGLKGQDSSAKRKGLNGFEEWLALSRGEKVCSVPSGPKKPECDPGRLDVV
jgi:hypothetical protein